MGPDAGGIMAVERYSAYQVIKFSLFQTLSLWDINPRLWLTAYLEPCAAAGRQQHVVANAV